MNKINKTEFEKDTYTISRKRKQRKDNKWQELELLLEIEKIGADFYF